MLPGRLSLYRGVVGGTPFPSWSMASMVNGSWFMVGGVDGRRMVLYRKLTGDLARTVTGYPRSGLFVLASRRARHLYHPRLSNVPTLRRTRRVVVKTRSIRGGVRALTTM